MKTTSKSLMKTLAAGLLAAGVVLTPSANADLLLSFPFNEGSGTNVVDTAQGLQGYFGYRHDPAVDTVTITPDSPSGQPGDNSVTTAGSGFLMVNDSPSPVLDITNGPITIECWINIDPYVIPKRTEGIVAYGSSYKLGMISGRPMFTLFGIADMTNATAGALPAGTWTHVAAAWEPGVGVRFYVNGVSNFTANTNIAARPPVHNYLSIGAESQVNNVVASFDRVRIHHALLGPDELDLDPVNPKAPLPNTVVAYNFNETSFPCDSAVTPSRPTMLSQDVAYTFNAPKWTSDSPTGLPGDFSLAFNTNLPPFREFVQVNYPGESIPLGANNTNYTLEAWVKLPTDGIEDRRVIFRGPTNAPRVALSVHVNRTMHTTLFGNKDFDSPVQIPNDNRWHHLAVVMEDFARMKFFLDGIHRFTTNRTATGNPTSASAAPNLLIGQESDTRFYKGLLDRVRIHNNALTEAQLDFPAIPGQAVVTAHPVDVSADAGGTAQFTATVTSPTAATYQWYYRTNRADLQGTPIPGATSTTLNLSGLTAAHQGFYYLKITNSAGVSESYAGRLMVRSGAFLTLDGFESPKYTSGPLEDQDFWATDQNGNVVRVQTASQIESALLAAGLTPGQTVHSGSQAVLITGAGLATASIRPVLGFENSQVVSVGFWARPLTRGTTSLTTNNTFITFENSAGTRAAAVRFGSSQNIDYNSGNAWLATGQKWAENTWYQFTVRLDYAAKTYDVLINGLKINTNPIPFYYAASDVFSQIRIYRGSGQAGMILDDLSVAGPPLRVSEIQLSGNNVNINWQGGIPPYQLQRRASLATGQWENIGNPTTATQATDTVAPSAMFYRVISQ